MADPLNERQSKAVAAFDSDLVVTAGAGTGKTRVLTSKFIRLLEERRAEAGEIIAITFTNKAAAEMRGRIQQAVREHLEAAAGTGEAGYWKNQLLKLENARICTFHSLCLGLLREYPLEAGITPVTGILSEGEEAVYLNQAAAAVLTREFHQNTRQRPALARMLQDYGWDRLLNDLIALYQSIRESGSAFAEIIDLSAARLRQQETCNLTSLAEEIEELLDFSLTQKLTERAAAVINSFREKWPVYKRSLASENLLEEALPALFGIRKALPGNLPHVLKDRVTMIHDQLAALSSRLRARECLTRLPAVGALLEGIDREYSRIKLEQGLVDFTDQQLLACNLLRQHPDIADRVRRGIKYLLVDEFQDTNGLQAELIGLLLGSGYQGGRLMAVGDIKQSIYRFRGAEAELISDLCDQVRKRGGEVIALSQNYRSAQLIIGFVNRISRRLFSDEAFEYEPLEATSSEPGAGIEFLLTGTDDRTVEAKMVARRIAQLVRENPSGSNPINYGDIVLLFRAGSSVMLYQQALQELGIPYYNSCGGDFYRRQEIIDQLNLLRLIQQRYDAPALLALLTSPYVGLSEFSLFWLGRNADLAQEFYESREFPPEIPAVERERLYHFRELLLRLQQQREHLQIPEILRTAIEHCHYRELLWASSNGSQRVANIEKLLVKADEFIAKGFHDLNRFLAYLAALEGMGVLEGEAPTEAELGNVVRLMTIHRSKGLEFPVVIIPELDRQFNFRKQGNLLFHKKVGLGMTIPLEEEEAVNSSLLEEIKTRNKREEISELKRLLYVAMTRAKQQLILAGSGCSGSRGNTLETANSWMRWFELLLPLSEAGDFFDYEGVPVRVVRDLPEAEIPPRTETILESFLPELETEACEPKAGREVAAAVATETETFKVSEILTYLNCPRRYFWQYRMRLNGSGSAPADFDAAEPHDKLGVLIGEFMHQAAGGKKEEWPEELWEEIFTSCTDLNRVALKEDLIRIWRNFRNSPYTEKAGKCWDEVPFLLKLTPELRVEGRFDRLLQNQVGEMILVDYKTHRVSADLVNEIAASYYPQLQLYSLAIKALWGRLPDRAVLYFPYPNQGVEVPLDQGSLERLVTEVERMAKFVRGHDLPAAYPKCGNCQNCGYEWSCK